MKFTATKEFDLYAIGDIRFRFDRKQYGKGTKVFVGDVNILNNTSIPLDKDTKKALDEEMTIQGSDLLTDGKNFFTITNGGITQIEHSQFIKALTVHNELNPK